MGMSLSISVAAETAASESFPSKLTSASAAIPAFRQCLPSRCLAIDHSITITIVIIIIIIIKTFVVIELAGRLKYLWK
jgi:hypothetical protein